MNVARQLALAHGLALHLAQGWVLAEQRAGHGGAGAAAGARQRHGSGAWRTRAVVAHLCTNISGDGGGG